MSDAPTAAAAEPLSSDDVQIYTIVFTGGPCGGKTTALAEVSERLRSIGLQVFHIPENSTIFFNAGAGFPATGTEQQQQNWEIARMTCQMSMEDSFRKIARASGKTTVILHDRGTMDAAAYMSEERWASLLKATGWTEESIGMKRYDLVIHLMTAAIDAEQFYTKGNNAARREDLSQARELDQRIRGVWSKHPNFRVIDNKANGFTAKIRRVVTAICNFLGVLSPQHGLYKRFLLRPSIMEFLPQFIQSKATKIETFQVSYTFLSGSDSKVNQCVRLRKQGDTNFYTYSRKFITADGQTGISERSITRQEYRDLISRRDPLTGTFQRTRHCFLYGDQYFEIDILSSNTIVQVDFPGTDSDINFPEWLKPFVDRCITDDLTFDLYRLARQVFGVPLPEISSSPDLPLALDPEHGRFAVESK
eukprot:TRINITY_DN1826_c0_g1_i1.p1 TRINITY_DN1826_c0_g1~~TRINITY_DN1826_c0_g1_i1.p1  ORF type:complete len:420 (-),score=90.27 TRINITY_DN1826_c0_g1_i1:129-1388(-)